MTNPDNVGGLRYTDHNVMNGALCDFATRWRIDGDYIRCGTCDRPQLTSYADNDFPHADFCRVKDSPSMERRPWQTYVALLAPLCRAAPAGGAPESLVKWERDYDDTHLAPYCREDVKRLLADWRASIAAPAGGDDLYRQACDSVEEWKARALEAEADIARIHAQINAENGPTFMGEPVVSAPAVGRPYGGDPAEPRDDSDRYDSAPAGSGEALELADRLDRDWDSGRVDWDNVKDAAALLRKLQQGADENSLRAVAKRNLRSLINIGSDDKALMLKCLEELS